MATTSAIGIISTIMKEDFPNTVEDLVPFGTDPILQGVFLDGAQVFNKLGRPNYVDNTNVTSAEWAATHKFRLSPGGVLQWANIASTDTNAATNRLLVAGQSFPAATSATQSEYLTMSIPVKMCMGNVAANIKTLKSMDNTDVIFDHVQNMIKDQVKLLKSHLSFAVYGDGTGAIATVASCVTTSTATDDAGDTGYITLSSTDGAIRGFYRNMYIDIYDTAGNTKRNTYPLLVTAVDYLNNKIHFVLTGAQAGSADMEDNCIATDVVYIASSKGYLPNGLENFIISSGSIFGAALTTYPELSSYIPTDHGSTERTLTPEILNKFLDHWADNGIGEMPDLMISSRGVRSAYAYNLKDAYQNQPVAPSAGDIIYDGGFRGTKYSYENTELKWFVSPYIKTKNALYVLRKKDLKLYAPDGSSKVNWFYSDGGLSDANGIWAPVYNLNTTDNITQSSYLIEAPYSLYIQFASTMPQNMGKLTYLKDLSDLV